MPSTPRIHESAESAPPSAVTWLGWILGAAGLGALVLAVVHYSEERELAAVLQTARPIWLAVALVAQAATYAAQAEVWRRVMRAGGEAVSLRELFRLSLTKLFASHRFDRHAPLPRPELLAAHGAGAMAVAPRHQAAPHRGVGRRSGELLGGRSARPWRDGSAWRWAGCPLPKRPAASVTTDRTS